MANQYLGRTLATFQAVVHRTKNRLVAIPAQVQRNLGLDRGRHNHVVLYSIRPSGRGRWNHHLSYLTYDNEFAIPADVTHIKQGAQVDIKLHRVIPDGDALAPPLPAAPAGSVLVTLAEEAEQVPEEDPRVDGSIRLDDYLYPPHA